MKKKVLIVLLLVSLFMISSCSNAHSYLHIQKVGMLVNETIETQPWDKEGYDALQEIGKAFDVTVYLREEIKTKYEMIQAVDELVGKGVNLIFGHSASYGRVFVDISHDYPEVQFIYLEGNYFSDNVTSVQIATYAASFFNGLIASQVTKTGHIGVIVESARHQEIEGFYEGVKVSSKNKTNQVHLHVIHEWDKDGAPSKMYETMKRLRVDVLYLVGESFPSELAEQATGDKIYTLGYSRVSQQKESLLLARTTKHIDQVYLAVAKKFNEKNLAGGRLIFDFADGAISLNDLNETLSRKEQKEINQVINRYIEEGILPESF